MKVEILNSTNNPLTVIGKNSATCYDTQIKDEGHPRRIAEHCLRSGHMRNIEFADITFKVTASARVIRELYTHVGGAPTRVQASTRYITYNNFEYVTPRGMTKEQEQAYIETMYNINEGYKRLKELGCENDITGYVLPLAMESTCIVKMNARTLENLFNQRLCNRALKEFRELVHILKGAIIDLGEEWKEIALKYFVVKCDKLGYCPEDYSCSKVKQGATLSKEEFNKAIREAENKKFDARISKRLETK